MAHEGAETVEVGEKSAASEVVSNGEGVVEVVDSASLIVGGFVGEEDGSEVGVGAAAVGVGGAALESGGPRPGGGDCVELQGAQC